MIGQKKRLTASAARRKHSVTAAIEDKDQTVTFSEKPEIKTTATVNGGKKAEPAGEVTIKDTVSYTGLTPGKTYKLSGVLMDKSSGGKLLVDGKEITAEKEFTPKTASGTEEITFTLDASTLAGKSVVVFESLYHHGKEVAAHTDINDVGQTVEFDGPEIRTKATVGGEKEVDPLEKVMLIDTVTYFNLTPGKTYTVKGVLIDPVGKPCGAAKVAEVQEYIDPAGKGLTATVEGKTYTVGDGLGNGVANIGAHFTAVGAEALEITVTFGAELASGATKQAAQEEAAEAIERYLKELVLDAGEGESVVVRVSAVGAILSQMENLVDYSDLRLNGDTHNITPGEEDVPVLRGVEIA